MSTRIQTNRIVPRSIVRYRPIAPDDVPTWQRRATHSSPSETGVVASSPALAATVACGMGIALVLIVLGQLVLGWAQTALDDWHYGRPRLSQVDQYVGHEQAGQPPSHFLALNNRGRVEVIELPGNDPTRARIFLGPQLSASTADLVPATIDFLDPHHTRYPDLIVRVGTVSVAFHNTHESFVLQRSPS